MPTDSLMIEKTHCLPFHRELLSPQLLRSGLVDPGRGEAGGERESGGGGGEENRFQRKHIGRKYVSGPDLHSSEGYFPTCYDTWNARGHEIMRKCLSGQNGAVSEMKGVG